MHKRITFLDMEHSTFLENYANEQLEKVITFLKNEQSPIYIDFVMKASKTHANHLVELRVKTPHYFVISKYEGPDFYDILDRVIDIMYLELHEKKRERTDDKKMVGRHDEFKKQR